MYVATCNDNAASNVFWTFGVAIKDGKLDALRECRRPILLGSVMMNSRGDNWQRA